MSNNETLLQNDALATDANSINQTDETNATALVVENNKPYTIPKNAKKLTPEEIDALAPYQRKEYEASMTRPRKVGYAIVKRRYNSFYTINIFDFLPFFLGTIISFIRFCVGYGDLKSQVSFDKRLLWDFKSAFILGCVYTFFIVPLILVLIMFVYPFIIVDGSEVTKGWNSFISELNNKGIASLGTAMTKYYDSAISPIFSQQYLMVTLILFLVLSMLNTKTFLFQFLLRQKRDRVFAVQKNSVKDEIIKLKASKKK